MSIHHRAGWDSFTPAPGEEEKMSCRVCGEDMEVNRNVNGPTGYVEAMAKRGHPHDHFFCKNSGEDWHNQVLRIRQSAEENPSKLIAHMMSVEANEIILTRKATKDCSTL
tara:strand:+ start:292 stop:621 length:330 start_codon:yes stop_codon:yes gene_type:complete